MQKTRIDVVPFISINGVNFGTPREDVHKAFGTPEDSFVKFGGDTEIDVYSCFHAFYDDNYKFDGIEVIYPDEADIYYGGEKVPETYDGALEFFSRLYDDTQEDGAGFMTVKGSMGVYVDEADEYDTILFARKGYYDELDV